MLHPVSCTCLATPPAVGHFLSYIWDKFGCYAHPFWNLLLRDMCHEKSAWKTNLAVILFQSPVLVMTQIPGFARLRIGAEGEQLCHTLKLQEEPAAPERGSLTFLRRIKMKTFLLLNFHPLKAWQPPLSAGIKCQLWHFNPYFCCILSHSRVGGALQLSSLYCCQICSRTALDAEFRK